MTAAPTSVDIPLRSDSLQLIIDTTIPRRERLSSNTVSTNSNRSSVRAELASASTVDSIDRPKMVSTANTGLTSTTGSLRTLEQLSKGQITLSADLQKLAPSLGGVATWAQRHVVLSSDATMHLFSTPTSPTLLPIAILPVETCAVSQDYSDNCFVLTVSGPTHNPDGTLTALSWSLKFPDEPLMMVWLRTINRMTGRVGTAAFRRNRSATEASGPAAAAALANLRVLGIGGSNGAASPRSGAASPILMGSTSTSGYISPLAIGDGTGMPLLSRSATVSGLVRAGQDDSRVAKMQAMRNEYVNMQLKVNAEKFKKAEALNQKLREYEIQDQTRRAAEQQAEAKKKQEKAVKMRADAIQKSLGIF
ncbi:hypothetical protein HDU84_004165 [Entophlyctis sp. JEL0112]|nr:hypothetical protein HDU84_004165 [Entophlyctis sp. JEL0112]